MRIMLLGLACLCACSQAQTMRYPRLGVVINRTTLKQVHEVCGSPDDICCAEYQSQPCVIWASRADCIPHELTHCDLRNDDEAAAQVNEW